ncbi:hypothetical protein [Sulfuricurvum sp.]|uniref:hypothetical protein n=1 Tax=Sulfuricurvum sp. TaxID=2025608 RepID=UPI003BB5FAAA
MQTVHLEIQNDLKDALLAFLKLLPPSAVRIYEDDDTTFTKDDEIAFNKAMDEKKKGQTVGFDELKRKYL